MRIAQPALGVMYLHAAQLGAALTKRTFFLQVRMPVQPTFTGVSMMPTKLSCPLSARTHLPLCGNSLE
jgi:hypothetical protein